MSKLIEASIDDAQTITNFLSDMIVEVGEFDANAVTHVSQAVRASFQEKVYWFLFLDEKNEPFGTCYLQSVHNYWRTGKRYYLGGLFFAPTHRGQKRFPSLYQQLKKWAEAHDGVQIYSHIDPRNTRSMKTFAQEGFSQSYCNNYVHSFEGE